MSQVTATFTKLVGFYESITLSFPIRLSQIYSTKELPSYEGMAKLVRKSVY